MSVMLWGRKDKILIKKKIFIVKVRACGKERTGERGLMQFSQQNYTITWCVVQLQGFRIPWGLLTVALHSTLKYPWEYYYNKSVFITTQNNTVARKNNWFFDRYYISIYVIVDG